MGTVYKQSFTKPMPAGAELFVREGQRFAKWKDAKGKTRKERVTVGKDGTDRLIIESALYFAKYRDGDGHICTVATGCRDETAARNVLARLERRGELVKAKVITNVEAAVSDHQSAAIADHFASYHAHLEAAGVSQMYRDNVRRQLDRLADDCSFGGLADMSQESMERWLASRAREGMGARTRNTYLVTANGFSNWCVDPNVRRMASNPFAGVAKANEKADPRRQRRAMTEAELTKLLDVARRRPLLEALTVRTGKRKGKACAKVKPAVRDRLDMLGRERALTYKTLVLTGLRLNELRSLTVGKLDLDGPYAFANLAAADEKNRQGSEIVLRDDLAADLRAWLADKLTAAQAEARNQGTPIPARLPKETPLFDVSAGLLRILDRDLRAAGIAKRDERGRSLDVHALRFTFGTLLSKGGVMPRTAQAAMRHSKIDLTMNIYTDPKLLDIRGAVDSLPSLPLNTGHATQTEVAKATGTEGLRPSTLTPLTPLLTPTLDNSGISPSIVDKGTQEISLIGPETRIAVMSYAGNGKGPLTHNVNGPLKVEPTGVEPVTSRMPF